MIQIWQVPSECGPSNLVVLGKGDARLFWIGLFVAPLMWVIFFLTALFGFKFQWMILVIIGLTMSMSNLLGYLRCRLGTIHILRKQFFSTKINLTSKFFTRTGFFFVKSKEFLFQHDILTKFHAVV